MKADCGQEKGRETKEAQGIESRRRGGARTQTERTKLPMMVIEVEQRQRRSRFLAD